MKKTKNATPYHVFKGLIRLVSSEFEKKFLQFNEENNAVTQLGWSPSAKQKGLFIDLSQVRWVEMSAAAQVVLLVESAKKSDLKVTIALPLAKHSKGETEDLSKLRNQSESLYKKRNDLYEVLKNLREDAKSYLTNLQFQRTVVCPHIKTGEVVFNEDYHFESPYSQEQYGEANLSSADLITQNLKRPEEIGYKFLIPLTWIKVRKHNSSLDFIEEKFTEILSQAERGLDSIDALAIKNVIINELLKNVKEHSGCEDALIGVALQPSRILDTNYYLQNERNFIDWIGKANTNYISIFFGDTGDGLCHTLRDAFVSSAQKYKVSDSNIIKWAFDKWSTSKTNEEIRGTKGLYRILRIINKYNGMICVRTSRENSGFQKGGLTNSRFIHQLPDGKGNHALAYLPGTSLKMMFSPFKELNKFNIMPQVAQYYKDENYQWKTISIQLNSINPKETFSGSLSVKNIFGEHKTNILILIDAKNSRLEQQEEIEEAIRNHLLYLSEARHPNGVIIYGFPTGWESIEGIANSINLLIEEHRAEKLTDPEADDPNEEIVYDPVLVLGENRQYCWVGGNNDIINCLNELYRSENPKKKLTELQSYNQLNPAAQTRVKQYFMSDDAVVSLEHGQALRFNFSNLKTHFSEKIGHALNEATSQQTEDEVYFVTPNLRNVKYWISIDRLIKNDLLGYAFALSAALKELQSDLPENLSAYKVLIDNIDSYRLAVEFCNWLGIPSKNIINFNDEVDGRLPRRNPIFEEHENVIILTTIISTKETARRSIKAVLRDLANPIAVLGIINHSTDGVIKAWEKKIPAVSLINNVNYEITDTEITLKNLKPVYKAPYGYYREEPDEAEEQVKKAEIESLFGLIVEQKALHFSHLGKTNNRHFTFYLSANRLLNDEEKSEKHIYSRFYIKIKNWLDETGEKKFDIWRSTPDFKKSNPVNKITNRIEKYFTDGRRNYSCNAVFEIKRASNYGEWNLIRPEAFNKTQSENVVIVDWGSLTGNTTQQMMNHAAAEGKKNILVCILFSQLPLKEERFLTNIRKVQGKTSIDRTILFNEQKPEDISSAISVNFFYRLPLKNYESADCPVCEHIHALREFEIKGEHMSDFYSKRRERLKIKDKEKTDQPPQDFYANENVYLDSEVIMSMFKFRLLLQEALLSTVKRKEVEIFLEQLNRDIEKEKRKINSEIYAVLYFLSVEIMWMQKPPLVFLSVRKSLTQIAKTIATWKWDDIVTVFGDVPSVVRYKFAAISVLRSSDKNEFLKSIAAIFKSSFRGDSYSHSLTQNLFYHTYSFLKRPYHSSPELLNTITGNINEMLNANNLVPKLKNAIVFLKFYAEKRKYEIRIPSQSAMSVFHSYKREINENYGQLYKHNDVQIDFKEIQPVDFKELLSRLHASDDTPSQEQINSITGNPGFLNWLDVLPARWADVAAYLNNVVINHLGKLDDLLNSKFFNSLDTQFTSFIKQMLTERKLFGVNDNLTLLINEILTNPAVLTNKKFYAGFNDTYFFYYNNFIHINPKDQRLSCLPVKLSLQIPCRIDDAFTKAINQCYKRADEEKVKLKIEKKYTGEFPVFFPYSQFKHFLDQVFYYNLFKHQVPGMEIKVVIFILKDETGHITIQILNKGTQPGNRNMGGLYKFNTEFNLFGGQLNYGYDNSKKQFDITIKLKLWKDE
jgi:orotate phosphoribosyltransferase-like protein